MNRKSFTLIELLVVIAVISLLASLIIVNLTGVRSKANIARGLQFSQSVHHALGAYAVGVWSFDEGSGTTANDSSGYNNHGTLVNGPVWRCASTDPNYTPSGQGCALQFDGTNDYINIEHNILPELVKNFSVSVWVYSNVSGGQYGILSTNGYPNGWTMYMRQGPQFSFIGYINGSSIGTKTTPSGEISENNWYHIIYTYDNEKIKGYINGELKHESNLTGDFDVNNNILRIGHGPNLGSPLFWNGLIDDVCIYATALSVSQIRQLYAETAPKYRLVLE